MTPIPQLLIALFLLSIVTLSNASVYYKCDISPAMTQLGNDFKKKDLEGRHSLKTLFQNSSITEIKALANVWKQLPNNPDKRRAVEVLKTTVKHLNEPPFKNNANLTTAYINAVKAYAGSTSASTGYTELPKNYIDYFNELFDYAKNFKNVPSFSLAETTGSIQTQDGFYLAMRYMNAKINPSQITKIDMRFDSLATCSSNCRLDLEIEKDTPLGKKKIQYEFKSYAANSQLKQINQLVGYLSGAEDLNSFKYVFNAEKLSLQEARVKMTTFINENKQAVFDGIKSNASLQESVSPGRALQFIDDLTPDMIQTIVNTVVEVY